MKYRKVILGGTFDHFHKGHRGFLRFALGVSNSLIIGITSDNFVKRKAQSAKRKTEPFESYTKRKGSVGNFLREERVADRTQIVKIDNVFGPTLDRNIKIDGIVVVKKTLKGAETVNKKRTELGLIPLEIAIAPEEFAQDGKVVSSSRIRNGEIDRNGNPYFPKEFLGKDIKITENVRGILKKPYGQIVKDVVVDDNLLITVGDITTQRILKLGFLPNLAVVDFRVKREEKFNSLSQLGFKDVRVINVDNPAGGITAKLNRAVSDFFKKNSGSLVIKVDGEEDLAVIPIILTSPLGTVIFYGQPASPAGSQGGPEEGLVKIEVSEEIKNRTRSLIVTTRGY